MAKQAFCIVRGLRPALERGQLLLEFSDAGERRFLLPNHRQQRQDEGILLRDGQIDAVDLRRYAKLASARP